MLRNVAFMALGFAMAGVVAGLIAAVVWVNSWGLSDEEQALASFRIGQSFFCDPGAISVDDAYLCRGEDVTVAGTLTRGSGVEHRTDGFGIVGTLERDGGLTPAYVVARRGCSIFLASFEALDGREVVADGHIRWDAPPLVIEICDESDFRPRLQ